MGIQQFIATISGKKKTQGQFDILPLTQPIHVLTAGSGSVIPMQTVYWTIPYLASEYEPLATNSGVTKRYFLTYSTDHALGPDGEMRMGQCDNLDLSDLEDVGLIKKGYQNEAALLLRSETVPDDEVFHFYYHTNNTDPGNGGNFQRTRLFTTSGASLLNLDSWTDRGRPLPFGITPKENHDGYLNPQRLSKNHWVAYHLIDDLQNGKPRGAIVSSTNGRDWTRLGVLENPPYWKDQGYRFARGDMRFMKLNGEIFTVTVVVPDVGVHAKEMKIVLAQTNESMDFVKDLGYINEGVLTNFVKTYQDTNTTFWMYWSVEKKQLWCQKWKLTNGTMSPRIVDQN